MWHVRVILHKETEKITHIYIEEGYTVNDEVVKPDGYVQSCMSDESSLGLTLSAVLFHHDNQSEHHPYFTSLLYNESRLDFGPDHIISVQRLQLFLFGAEQLFVADQTQMISGYVIGCWCLSLFPFKLLGRKKVMNLKIGAKYKLRKNRAHLFWFDRIRKGKSDLSVWVVKANIFVVACTAAVARQTQNQRLLARNQSIFPKCQSIFFFFCTNRFFQNKR